MGSSAWDILPCLQPSVSVSDLCVSLPMPCMFAHLDLDSDLLNPDLLNLFSPKLKDSRNLLFPLGPGFGLLLRQDRLGSVLMVTQKRIISSPDLSLKLQACSSISFLKRKHLPVSKGILNTTHPSNTEPVNFLLPQLAFPPVISTH